MALALSQTPQSSGTRLITCVSFAAGARWDVVLLGLFSGALVNCSFPSTFPPQLQENRFKTRLCSHCDGHALGWHHLEGPGSPTGGLSPRRSPHTLRAHMAPRPSSAGETWPSQSWLLAATTMSVAITATFCFWKMIKWCLSCYGMLYSLHPHPERRATGGHKNSPGIFFVNEAGA